MLRACGLLLCLLSVFGVSLLVNAAGNSTAPAANWTTDIGFQVILWPIEIGSDRIFLGGSGTVMVLNKDTGAIVWSKGGYDVSTQNTGVALTPHYFPSVQTPDGEIDLIVFCTASNHVRALDASSGSEIWVYHARDEFPGFVVGPEWIVLTTGMPAGGSGINWLTEYKLLHIPSGSTQMVSGTFADEWSNVGSRKRGLYVTAGHFHKPHEGTTIIALEPNVTKHKWKREFKELIVGVYSMWFAGDNDEYLIVSLTSNEGLATGIFVLDSETGKTIWSDYNPKHKGSDTLHLGGYLGHCGNIGVFKGTRSKNETKSMGVDLNNGTALWTVPYQPDYPDFRQADVTEDCRYVAYIGPDAHHLHHWPFSIYDARNGSLIAHKILPFPGFGTHYQIDDDNPPPRLVGDTFYYLTENSGLCAATAHGNPAEEKWCTGSSYNVATTLSLLFDKTYLFFNWAPQKGEGYLSCYKL